MASRNKADCNQILIEAYNKAEEEFRKQFPSKSQPFITCTYRSNDEQNELYKKVPKVTNAKAGESPHNYYPSLAFDIAFIKGKTELDWDTTLFKLFADIIKNIEPKVVWGGDFKGFTDKPHFELKDWQTLKNK